VGMITVCTVGYNNTALASFDLGTSTLSAINITGGTVVVQLPNSAASGPRDYRNSAGSGTTGVTGGILQMGNASSGVGRNFTIGSVVPNLVLDNSSGGGHTTTFPAPVNYNNITRDITIG